MCDKCIESLRSLGVPEEIIPNLMAGAAQLHAEETMQREAVLHQRDLMADLMARSTALNAAVQVKGVPINGNRASSKDVLASAHAYYDFLTGRDTR